MNIIGDRLPPIPATRPLLDPLYDPIFSVILLSSLLTLASLLLFVRVLPNGLGEILFQHHATTSPLYMYVYGGMHVHHRNTWVLTLSILAARSFVYR